MEKLIAQGIVSDVDNIEKQAWAGEKMPEGLTFAEQCYFMALRALFSEYKQGLADKDRVKREKSSLYSAFTAMASKERLHAEHAERHLKLCKLWTETHKSGCEVCKRIENVYTGLPEFTGVKK